MDNLVLVTSIDLLDKYIFILSQIYKHVNSHYRVTDVGIITALKSRANQEKRIYFLKWCRSYCLLFDF